MKTWIFLMALLTSGSAYARVEAGPRGGRMLETETARAEFYVNEDRRIEIRFYDETNAVLKPGDQIVSAIAEAASGKTRIEFQKEDDAFISAIALPDGDGYTVVVQIRAAAADRPKNFRIPLHLETCGECSRAEYACTCEHAEDDHGHAH